MRVGIDTFSIRELELDPFQTLDWIVEHGFAGAQWGGVRSLSPNLDREELKAVRQRADSLGLYSHVSVAGCNPHQIRIDPDDHRKDLIQQIEAAAAHGWHELHSCLGGGNERYMDAVAWTTQLRDSAEFIRSLAPVLRAHGSRIDLETHGEITTFELIRMIEDLGPDVLGICLDTANLFCQCEEPVRAIRRAAPYTHLTHIKDGMIVFTDTGFRRQTLPPGRGVIPWRIVLPILAEFEPNLPLSIEDHKWLFKFHVFDPHWLRLHPDLTLDEYAAVMRIGVKCEEKMAAGELPHPDAYEPIPYLDELEERLAAGLNHLNGLIQGLDLEDQPQYPRNYRSLQM